MRVPPWFFGPSLFFHVASLKWTSLNVDALTACETRSATINWTSPSSRRSKLNYFGCLAGRRLIMHVLTAHLFSHPCVNSTIQSPTHNSVFFLIGKHSTWTWRENNSINRQIPMLQKVSRRCQKGQAELHCTGTGEHAPWTDLVCTCTESNIQLNLF